MEQTNSRMKVHPEVLGTAIQELIDLFVNEEIFEIGTVTGRQLRRGELEVMGALADNVASEFNIVDQPGVDIFGESLANQIDMEVDCPNCNRSLAAVRFASHLERCIGKGRNSSRNTKEETKILGSTEEAMKDENGQNRRSKASKETAPKKISQIQNEEAADLLTAISLK